MIEKEKEREGGRGEEREKQREGVRGEERERDGQWQSVRGRSCALGNPL